MTYKERVAKLKKAFGEDGFEVHNSDVYFIRGNWTDRSEKRIGITAKHKQLKNSVTGKPKKVFYVEGTPFDMGYLMGRMAKKDIKRMTKDYIDKIPEIFLEKADDLDPKLLKSIKKFFRGILEIYAALFVQNSGDIPEYFDEELDGMVEGSKRVFGTPVLKRDLWILNIGFETLAAVGYTGFEKTLELLLDSLPDLLKKLLEKLLKKTLKKHKKLKEKELKIKLKDDEVKSYFFNELEKQFKALPMCNGFSAFGNVTENQSHYFGRDFMFPPAGVLQDTSCMIIYNPDNDGRYGDSFPLVSITAPGIVGSMSCMNIKGIACGMDMAAGANVDVTRPGFNTLLLARHIIQRSASAKSAVRHMESVQRGVTWDYIIADGYYDEACVVEAGCATAGDEIDFLSYPSYAEDKSDVDIKDFLPTREFIEVHQKLKQQNGMMVRWSDYQYPDKYLEFNKRLFELFGKEYKDSDFGEKGFINKTKDDKNCPYTYYFAPLRMNNPNIILVSNQYMIPEMRLCSMSNQVKEITKNDIDDIRWRYDALNSYILESIEGDRKIDYKTAKKLINYLSPEEGEFGGKYPDYYKNRKELKVIKNGKEYIMINGVISIFDLKKITVETLCGYYGDGFIKISLKKYVESR